MIQGFFREFVDRVRAHYVTAYGEKSEQVGLCKDGYWYEPSVAEKIFEGFLKEHPLLKVFKNHQLETARTKNGRLVSVAVKDRASGQRRSLRAKVFADATYEGDLLAGARRVPVGPRVTPGVRGTACGPHL